MACAPVGVNLNKMILTGHSTLVLHHPRRRDHRQMSAEQVSCLSFILRIANAQLQFFFY